MARLAGWFTFVMRGLIALTFLFAISICPVFGIYAATRVWTVGYRRGPMSNSETLHEAEVSPRHMGRYLFCRSGAIRPITL
jgi:hypothetical protein